MVCLMVGKMAYLCMSSTYFMGSCAVIDLCSDCFKVCTCMVLICFCLYQTVRGHPVSHDNRPRIETFQSVHPCSDDAIVTSHNRPHIETSRSAPFCRDNGVVTSHNRPHIEISRSAPFCRDNGVVTSHNRPHIETFRSAGPYIPPHHCPTFASQVRPHIEIFQSAGPHTPS